MLTKEVFKDYLEELLNWFPEDFKADDWMMLRYNEGIRYIQDRYQGEELHTIERSKLFWTWWNQTWLITDYKFLEACQIGCFDKASVFTLEHYKYEQEKGSYFMPRQLQNLILKQPIHQSHDTTAKQKEPTASSTQQCNT